MAKTVRYVPTFRAPTEYERQVEEARRRAALAEALAQQQYEPMEGNAAPIPKAAPLVKALQGYLTGRETRKAREAAEEAKGMEADYAQRMLGRMQGGYTYQPDAQLEQQMAKRPEETLDQYTQRMQATPFVGRAAPVPEQTELGEVTRQSQYRRAPEEVLGMASTGLGAAALKDRPVMAARLAQMLETPKAKSVYGQIDPLALISSATEDSRKAFDQSVAKGAPDYTLLRRLDDGKPVFTPDQIAQMRLDVANSNINRSLGLTNIPVDQQGMVPTAPTLEQLMAPLPQNLQNLNVRPAPQAPTAPTGSGGMAPPSGISYGAALETGEFAPGRGLQYSGSATTASGRPVAPTQKPAIERVSPKEYGNLVAKQPVDQGAAQAALGQVSMMRNFIQDLQQHGGTDYIFGPTQTLTPNIRGSATSAQSLFDTLRERSSVEALKQSRAEGFAPGSITEQEWPRFETAIGAIRGTKDARAMRLALENADKQLSDLEQRIINKYDSTYGNKFPLNWSPPSYKPESSLYPRPEIAAEDKAVFDRADQIIRKMQQRRK
jgi:hypothetical protein